MNGNFTYHNPTRPAVEREAVLREPGRLLALRLRRWLGLCHGIAAGPRRREVVLGVHERRERPAHVPFDVVGEHAQEDVRLHAVRGAVVDGPYEDVHPLEGAEGLLDIAERLVCSDHVRGGQPVRRLARADDVDAVKRLFPPYRVFVPGEGEVPVRDLDRKVIGHLVTGDAAPDLLPELAVSTSIVCPTYREPFGIFFDGIASVHGTSKPSIQALRVFSAALRVMAFMDVTDATIPTFSFRNVCAS